MADPARISPKLDLRSRPFKGLTVAQMAFLTLFGSGALLALMTPFLGPRIWVRAVVAFLVLTVGLLLAFLSPGGMSLAGWGGTLIRYVARPRRRAWRRTAPPVARPLGEGLKGKVPPIPAPAPALAREPLALSPVGLLFDLMLLCVLYLTTWYMASGGAQELVYFWQMLTGR